MDSMDSSVQKLSYERLPDESQAAFRAFGVYRDMHPLERSVALVEARLKKPVAHWARQYMWSSRVEDWDDYVDRRKRAARAREFEQRELEQIEALGEYQDLTRANLELWSELLVNGKPEDDSGPIMSLQEIRLSMDSLIKLTRLMNQESTEIVETKEVEKPNLSKLSVDELRQMRKMVSKIKERE